MEKRTDPRHPCNSSMVILYVAPPTTRTQPEICPTWSDKNIRCAACRMFSLLAPLCPGSIQSCCAHFRGASRYMPTLILSFSLVACCTRGRGLAFTSAHPHGGPHFCVVRALMPSLAVWLPRLCHRGGTGPSSYAHTSKKTSAFL